MANPKLPSTHAGAPNALGNAVEQPIQYIYDQRTGAQTVRRWKGNYISCLGISPGLQKTGWNTELACVNGPIWMLTATIGYSWNNTTNLDNPVDVWEILSNKVEKDFLNAQNSLVASLTDSDKRALQAFITNPPSPVPATISDTSTTPATPLSANGMTAYQLILAGVKSDEIFQPVVKHTQTTSSIYAVGASYDSVGKILATSTLSGLIPVSAPFVLPADPQFGKPGFAYGWLKNFPQNTASAFNKAQIMTTYEFGLWNTTMKNVPL